MNIDFDKGAGLVPAVIQDDNTSQVLMVGYLNKEAFEKTTREGKVTFYSRSRKSLWTKGETSGNFLFVKKITEDCDNDALLIKVNPAGPVCHTGTWSCFGDKSAKGFVNELEQIINQRISDNARDSYTNKLFRKGLNKVAQKVGEEAVELVVFAFQNAEAGDIMVQKSAASTIGDLAQAVKELFNADNEIKIIGTRHGEKRYETLLTKEEYIKADDMGGFFRVPADKRDLNYDKYFVEGCEKLSTDEEYNSDNTERLNVEQIKEKLLSLEYVREELEYFTTRNEAAITKDSSK